MRRIATLLSVASFLAGTAITMLAQQTMMNPPKVLVITREVVKPGKGAAHEKWEAGWPRAFTKANWPTHYIALSALTGEPRVLFCSGYESVEAWAKDGKAQEDNAALSAQEAMLADKDGDYISELRNSVLTLMPELSYHPDVSVAGTRYFGVVVFHVKRGHDDHFVAARKAAVAGHEKGNLTDHYAVYHVISGGPAGTYIIFIPMKSLAEFDQFPTVHGKAYHEALGAEGEKTLDDFEAQGLESSEVHLFALNSTMSYPSKEWIAADSFWAPKAAPAAKPAAKKDEAKKQ